MIRHISDFLTNRRNSDPVKPAGLIPSDHLELVSLFSQNLAILADLKKQDERAAILSRLSSNFDESFKFVQKGSQICQDVHDLFFKYSEACANYGAEILSDINPSMSMFSSLTFISDILNELPHSALFVQLFHSIVQLAKFQPEIFKISQGFITVLFTSEPFFREFLDIDGFSLVYTNFFLESDLNDQQMFYVNLLFSIVPRNFITSEPSETIIDLFISSLKENDKHSAACPAFIAQYISLFCSSDSPIIQTFEKRAGFQLFNAFILKNCSDRISEFYSHLLESTTADPIVVHSLGSILHSAETSQSQKAEVFRSLLLCCHGDFSIITIANSAEPLSSWISPSLDSEGLLMANVLLSELTQAGINMVLPCLSSILQICKPSASSDCPIDDFFETISTSMEKGFVSPHDLIERKFLEDFVLTPKAEVLASFLSLHPRFDELFSKVFCSPLAEEFRLPLLNQIITCAPHLSKEGRLTSMLCGLIRNSFSSQTFNLLLCSIGCPQVIDALTEESKRRKEAFKYFNDSHGLAVIDEELRERPENAERILALLAALCTFGEEEELDNWINLLPTNSPIFGLSAESINNAAEKLPSLMCLTAPKDLTSPFSLYLAGRYAVPGYLKRGIKLEEIPNIGKIINRYISPEVLEELMKKPKLIPSCLGQTVFPIYEFTPSETLAALKFNCEFLAVSFWYYSPGGGNFKIFETNFMSISIESSELKVRIGDCLNSYKNEPKWNHFAINFEEDKGKIRKVLYFLNEKLYSAKVAEDPIEEINFGGQLSKAPFYISKSVLLFEQNLTKEDIHSIIHLGPSCLAPLSNSLIPSISISDNVHSVPYLGFSSYFQFLPDADRIFTLLESQKSFDSFLPLFKALLGISKCNSYPYKQFWKRMLLSFKRTPEIFSSSINVIFPLIFPLEDAISKRTKILATMLQDIEIYFIFSPSCISSLLVAASDSSIFDCDLLDSLSVTKELCDILRMGISEAVSISIIQFLSFILASTPHILKEVFSLSISSSEWIHQIPFEISEFPIENLLNLPTTESSVQSKLLSACVFVLRLHPSIELFTYAKGLSFMSLFDDDRADNISIILAIFASHNPKYITLSEIAPPLFARRAKSMSAWISALSILCREMPSEILPQKIVIANPNFTPVILSMLASLAHQACEDFSSKLCIQIGTLFISLPSQQYSIFLENFNSAYLSSLMNLGFTPKSYSPSAYEEREIANWCEFEAKTLKIEELNSTLSECDSYGEFTNMIVSSEAFKNATTNSKFYTEDTPELNDSIDLTKQMEKVSLSQFIVSILMTSEPSQFSANLRRFALGNALMFPSHLTRFGTEFVFCLLTRLAFEDDKFWMVKPTVLEVASLAKLQLFKDKYVHLLSLILALLKTIQHLEEFLADESVKTAYKEILLCAFIQSQSMAEVFQVLFNYRAIVFSRTLFSDEGFSEVWLLLMSKFSGNTMEFVQCHLQFEGLRNRRTDYDIKKAEDLWSDYTSKLSVSISTGDNEIKVTKAKEVLEMKKKCADAASKANLSARILRVANLFIQTNSEVYSVNMLMRLLEKERFDDFLLKHKCNLLMPKSYHLSPLCLPFLQARALSPSPFQIFCPKFGRKAQLSSFQLHSPILSSHVKQVEFYGELFCSPEWCFFNECLDDSHLILQRPNQLLKLFKETFSDYGNFSSEENANLFYYIHTLQCVIMLSEKYLSILVLATLKEDELLLETSPQSPVAFLPFTESVSLSEFGKASLFCGHVVIFVNLEKVLLVNRRLYVHEPLVISILSLFLPEINLVFQNHQAADIYEKLLVKNIRSIPSSILNKPPSSIVLYSFTSPSEASLCWQRCQISNFDYLLVLNHFGSRSFTDLSQYPIVPWVSSPELSERDLSLPMGQLGAQRAAHFDLTFELSNPKYYYGFHYSLPGIVFWFLMRVPPFTYFQWDLNSGWDDSQRLFTSICEAYHSASEGNPSDLKELIPSIYEIPDIFINKHGIELGENVKSEVILPNWSNASPHFFTRVYRKQLEHSERINEWIDLVFGYKEIGDAALAAKNLFLPTSYHSSSAESLDMDEAAFKDQTLNFGQCPTQLFTKPHPKRFEQKFESMAIIEKKIEVSPIECQKIEGSFVSSLINGKIFCIPSPAAFHSSFAVCIDIRSGILALKKVPSLEVVQARISKDYIFATNVSFSSDGLFFCISYSFGRVDVFYMCYEGKIASSFIYQCSFSGSSECRVSAILSSDYLCASAFNNSIVIWSFASGSVHREIKTSAPTLALFFDDFSGDLYFAEGQKVRVFTLNAEPLYEAQIPGLTQCGLLPYDSSFDGRLLICGDRLGTISFFIVDSSEFALKKIGSKLVHTSAIASLCIDKDVFVVGSVDQRGHSYALHFPKRELPLCSVCGGVQAARCAKCGCPLCENCARNGLCKNCAKEAELPVTLRF